MDDRRARLVRTAFLAGAVTAALALVPMLSPPMARLVWGFEASDDAYRFATYGLVATEIAAVVSGAMPAWRMVPTWVLQAALLALFATAYHRPRVARWAGA